MTQKRICITFTEVVRVGTQTMQHHSIKCTDKDMCCTRTWWLMCQPTVSLNVTGITK